MVVQVIEDGMGTSQVLNHHPKGKLEPDEWRKKNNTQASKLSMSDNRHRYLLLIRN
jgi:hypothetical protein